MVVDDDTKIKVSNSMFLRDEILIGEGVGSRFDVYWDTREFILKSFCSPQQHYDKVNGDDFHDGNSS